MLESIGGVCNQNGAIEDKEIVAVELAIVLYFESLHIAKISTYAYGMYLYHTRMVILYMYGIQNYTIHV